MNLEHTRAESTVGARRQNEQLCHLIHSQTSDVRKHSSAVWLLQGHITAVLLSVNWLLTSELQAAEQVYNILLDVCCMTTDVIKYLLLSASLSLRNYNW
jgi:hypothetical protein